MMTSEEFNNSYIKRVLMDYLLTIVRDTNDNSIGFIVGDIILTIGFMKKNNMLNMCEINAIKEVLE